MKVLLIGKFPPGQGGISSRSYWLCHSLAERDIHFDIITIVPTSYRSESAGKLPNNIRLRQLIADEEHPWFIPGGGLWTERLISAAVELAGDHPPDLVEANYLAPYGFAAYVTSQMLDIPLLIRHAGSDLAKLYNWKPTRRALELLMIKADLMATTPDLVSQLPNEAAFSNPPVALPRYAPDPKIFCPSDDASSNPILLFAGKINYHWRLKALDTLLAALELRQSWKLEMVADGKGREAFETEAEKHELAERISRRSFVSPDQMPSLLSKATAVWAVERQGTIIDFSNIIWEALAVGRPCLVSSSMLKHPDAVQLRDSPLLHVVDPEDPASISEALDKAASMKVFERPSGIAKAFETYIAATADLYLKAARANGAT